MSIHHRIIFYGLLLAVLAPFIPHQTALADQGRQGRAYQIYEVKNGDTLAGIARRFDVSVRTIRSVNHLKKTRLKPGRRLKIPITGSLRGISGDNPCGGVHRVRPGDTLRSIARRCGVSKSRLLAFNHMEHARRLWVGQILRVPSKNMGGKHRFLPTPAY